MGFVVDTDLSHAAAASDAHPSGHEPMLYCPVCSRRLRERKCKLLCEQCGYYLSCADYY
jgi:methionyl-tRNA synthetase